MRPELVTAARLAFEEAMVVVFGFSVAVRRETPKNSCSIKHHCVACRYASGGGVKGDGGDGCYVGWQLLEWLLEWLLE